MQQLLTGEKRLLHTHAVKNMLDKEEERNAHMVAGKSLIWPWDGVLQLSQLASCDSLRQTIRRWRTHSPPLLPQRSFLILCLLSLLAFCCFVISTFLSFLERDQYSPPHPPIPLPRYDREVVSATMRIRCPDDNIATNDTISANFVSIFFFIIGAWQFHWKSWCI